MDEREPTETAATSPPVATTSPAPQMKILGQYLKDLSFENPNAPQSLNTQANQPEISISVNVNARTISPTDFEVELHPPEAVCTWKPSFPRKRCIRWS